MGQERYGHLFLKGWARCSTEEKKMYRDIQLDLIARFTARFGLKAQSQATQGKMLSVLRSLLDNRKTGPNRWEEPEAKPWSSAVIDHASVYGTMCGQLLAVVQPYCICEASWEKLEEFGLVVVDFSEWGWHHPGGAFAYGIACDRDALSVLKTMTRARLFDQTSIKTLLNKASCAPNLK